MSIRVAAFVQARLGSFRLPGKVLIPVAGQAVLAHVIRRVAQTRGVDDVVAVVPARDLALQWFARECGAKVYGGHEFDVLDRFFWAAKWFDSDVIMRVTADCPMWDPRVAEQVLDTFSMGHCDYASNVFDDHMGTTTDGLDVEVFSRAALEDAWVCAKATPDREHVTSFIRENRKRYRVADLRVGAHQGRWSLDTPEDLALVQEAYARLGRDFTWRQVDALGLAAQRNAS